MDTTTSTTNTSTSTTDATTTTFTTEESADLKRKADQDDDEAEACGIQMNESSTEKKDRKRGQNKKRKPIKHEERGFCRSFIRHNTCTYGDKCRHSHDVKEFLAQQKEDISGLTCPFYAAHGTCPFSIMCRLKSTHTPSLLPAEQTQLPEQPQEAVQQAPPAEGDESSQLPKSEIACASKEEAKVESKVESDGDIERKYQKIVLQLNERNSLSWDVQSQLRRRTYPLPRGTAFECTYAKLHVDAPSNDDAITTADDVISTKDDASLINSNDVTASTTSIAAEHADQSAPLAQVESSMEIVANVPVYSVDQFPHDREGSIVMRDKAFLKKVFGQECLYLAPLTTVGNLPFRRVCKKFGVDVTCGEMALAINILQGQQSEWALLKRHESEDVFGVQLCDARPEIMTKCAEVINNEVDVDFVDINAGCPIDMVYKQGAGSALLNRPNKLEKMLRGMSSVLDVPLTIKIRTGVFDKVQTAHKLIPKLKLWGASCVTLHGRSREQRYTRLADWQYISQCAPLADPIPFFGNGDVYSYEDAVAHRAAGLKGLMIGRGALIKPWIFTEIKENRHWDISSHERLEMMRDYVKFGLEHWGCDTEGVEKTRRFLLEWMSFLHRYIPVGILERVPHQMNERPPQFIGRDHLETMMASTNSEDWVKISEMLLGPRSENFFFVPKHKANSFATSQEQG